MKVRRYRYLGPGQLAGFLGRKRVKAGEIVELVEPLPARYADRFEEIRDAKVVAREKRADADELRGRLEEAGELIDQLTGERDQARAQLEIAERQVREMAGGGDALRAEHAELSAEVQQLRTALSGLAALKAELAERKAAQELAVERIGELGDEVRALKDRLEDERAALPEGWRERADVVDLANGLRAAEGITGRITKVDSALAALDAAPIAKLAAALARIPEQPEA